MTSPFTYQIVYWSDRLVPPRRQVVAAGNIRISELVRPKSPRGSGRPQRRRRARRRTSNAWDRRRSCPTVNEKRRRRRPTPIRGSSVVAFSSYLWRTEPRRIHRSRSDRRPETAGPSIRQNPFRRNRVRAVEPLPTTARNRRERNGAQPSTMSAYRYLRTVLHLQSGLKSGMRLEDGLTRLRRNQPQFRALPKARSAVTCVI